MKLFRLLPHCRQLSKEERISCFLFGLKEHIRLDVMAREPKDIWKVVGYAKLFELTNKLVYRTSHVTHEQHKVVHKDQVFQKSTEPSPT